MKARVHTVTLFLIINKILPHHVFIFPLHVSLQMTILCTDLHLKNVFSALLIYRYLNGWVVTSDFIMDVCKSFSLKNHVCLSPYGSAVSCLQ